MKRVLGIIITVIGGVCMYLGFLGNLDKFITFEDAGTTFVVGAAVGVVGVILLTVGIILIKKGNASSGAARLDAAFNAASAVVPSTELSKIKREREQGLINEEEYKRKVIARAKEIKKNK